MFLYQIYVNTEVIYRRYNDRLSFNPLFSLYVGYYDWVVSAVWYNLLGCFQLNVSYPATGCQKLFEVVDEHKLRIFYEKRMGAEVEADQLGDEWKGYILRVAGGNDKQGFPMKQGVLTNSEY